ncbi:hypothetical protein [Marisediminitalea aggregata]|nr:hypothetical protein [Marisediminitalea aggregata]
MTTVTEFPWHDVFFAGEHTDNQGKTRSYSRADLQQVVDNFAPNKAPLVIGHPKTNAPALGWVTGVRLTDDDRLEVTADNVNVDFAKAVAAKSFPNRSISLERTDKGLSLRHIGYLGAVEPALEGLGWQFNGADTNPTETVEFSAEPNETIEFSMEIEQQRSVLDMFSDLRDFIIDKFSEEEADRVLPRWNINWLRDALTRKEVNENEHDPFAPEFSKPKTEEPAVTTYTQEQLDAAIQQAKDDAEASFSSQLSAEKSRADNAEKTLEEQAFAARVADCKAVVDTQIAAGHLTPANAAGLAEFMASLQQGDNAQTFSFSKSDSETVEQSQYDFAKAFVGSLGAKSPMGDDPELAHDKDLDEKAEEYSKAHGVSYADAVIAVSQGA